MKSTFAQLLEIMDNPTQRKIGLLIFPMAISTALELCSLVLVLPVIQFAILGDLNYGPAEVMSKTFPSLENERVKYIFVVLFSSQMDTALEFYVVACVVGLVQGGVQAISRSFFSTLIPANKAAEFFGFYNFIGKSSVFIGPFMVSGIALVTGSPSYGILSLLILFIPGLILLWMVPDKN